MDKMKLQDQIRSMVERHRAIADGKFKVEGIYLFEHYRNGKVIGVLPIENDITNVGKNDILNSYFNGTGVYGTPYMGLVSATSFSAFSPSDTMASHGGWLEFTGYNEAARPAWGQGTAASQQMTNAVQVTFTINTGGTIQGGFINSVATKGGTTGLLWSTGALTAGPTPVLNGDIFKNSYILLV